MFNGCRSAVVTASAVACLCTLGTPALAQSTPPAVESQENRWWTGVNEGDAAALAQLFTSDAAFALGDEEVRGRDAIEAFATRFLAHTRFDCQRTREGVYSLPRLTAVLSHVTCTETSTGATPLQSEGRILKVYERQRDGSWLIVRASAETAQS